MQLKIIFRLYAIKLENKLTKAKQIIVNFSSKNKSILITMLIHKV